MAQTVNALSWKNCLIELDDENTFTAARDISGYVNSITVSGGTRVSGAAYTADGDTAVITRGKREPLTVTMAILYTEDDTETDPAYERDNIQTAYESGTDLYIRWSPAGGASGDQRFTTGACIVKQPIYPGGDASSGDPIAVEVVLETATITEANIT